ncbi:hypothetical protein cypCar_00042746 [Cyprinus carpio]|nr:hypothetical protein cypCar_00042746 [Cyprinus carpio]
MWGPSRFSEAGRVDGEGVLREREHRFGPFALHQLPSVRRG